MLASLSFFASLRSISNSAAHDSTVSGNNGKEGEPMTAEQYAERIHSAANDELWHILRAMVRDVQIGAQEYVDLAEMVFERRAELRKEIEE